MREILFKAKRMDNGEWIQGYLFLFWGKSYILWGMVNDSPDMIEVIPDTICQYTGLTDKNGNKIWENDILCGHENKDDLAKVVFGKFEVIDVETIDTVDVVEGWHTKPIITDCLSKCIPFCLPMPLTDFYVNRCEHKVIGNIFDNPELLKNE